MPAKQTNPETGTVFSASAMASDSGSFLFWLGRRRVEERVGA